MARKPCGGKEALSSAWWNAAIGAGFGIVSLLKKEDPSIDWTKRVGDWVSIWAGTSTLTQAQLDRGWQYGTADVVATIQLGLVQWIREDPIVMVQPSANEREGLTSCAITTKGGRGLSTRGREDASCLALCAQWRRERATSTRS